MAMSPAPALLGTHLRLAFFLGREASGQTELRQNQDPILEAGPGLEAGRGGTKCKGKGTKKPRDQVNNIPMQSF